MRRDWVWCEVEDPMEKLRVWRIGKVIEKETRALKVGGAKQLGQETTWVEEVEEMHITSTEVSRWV